MKTMTNQFHGKANNNTKSSSETIDVRNQQVRQQVRPVAKQQVVQDEIITPNTLLVKLGVNRVRISVLKKLGVETIHDLLTYYPRRMIPPAIIIKSLSEIEQLDKSEVKERKLLLNATILNIRIFQAKGGWGVARMVVTMRDDSGRLCEGLFFGKSLRYLKWLESKYLAGDEVLIVGVGKKSASKYQFIHPELHVYNVANSDLSRRSLLTKSDGIHLFSRPRLIYRSTKRLSSGKIGETIRTLIHQLESHKATNAVDPWSDNAKSTKPVTEQDLVKQVFPDIIGGQNRWQAIKNIHMPATIQEYDYAVEQLRFEEAYILQSLLASRSSNIKQSRAVPRVLETRSVLKKFDSSLPWDLTNSQREVGEIIAQELAKPIPMQRLLQGDVGSGKTVVALRAMLQVVDAGGQAVLLAPTEVLASQHFDSINKMLGSLAVLSLRENELQVRVELLTGSLTARQKRSAEHSISTGESSIIVGTHALLYRKDLFKDLGLIVVDEQHRFGVEQRNKLREQAQAIPHLLVMTATPIPRSVAMLMFSDLQISTLTEMPSGRGQIETHIVDVTNLRLVDRMWQRIREEIDGGRNVFVIAPRIHKSDMLSDADNTTSVVQASDEENIENELLSPLISNDLYNKLVEAGLEETLDDQTQSVEELILELGKLPALQNVEIGVLHGELSTEEKQAVMQRFARFEVPLLISTTVVEVGIDVPNASTMVIMDANKFGMASLHQLRGRIGRGKHPSICFLVTTKSSVSEIGAQRLETIAKYQDGFIISTRDLELRGEGNILGTQQSGGTSSLKLLRIFQDQNVIQLAHELALKTLTADPMLVKHVGLRLAIEREVSEQEKRLLVKS